MARDINFFSTYNSQLIEKKSQNIYGYAAIITLSTLIGGSLIYNYGEMVLINSRTASLQSKLNSADIQSKMQESDMVFNSMEILSNYDREIDSIVSAVNSRDIVNTSMLNKISSTIPTEVSFGAISITNTNITIQAQSTSRQAIAEVQHNLKQLDFISDVYIGSIGGIDLFTFSIDCTLKGGN